MTEKPLRFVKMTFIVGLALSGSCCLHTCRVTAGESNGGTSRADTRLLAPIPFGRLNGTEPYNASGIVPVGDSRFLVVDNRSDDALYELDLDDRGSVRNPLVTRSLVVPGGGIGDMEGLTAAEEHGRTWMFVASALDRKVKKKVDVSPRGGLLRVTMGTDGSLSAENVEGFREWFVRSSSDVGGSANVEPDEHGLNIEGLAWDAARHALLFGVRSPLSPNGEPLVIPVRVKNLGGPWDTSNLEMLPAIHLALPLPGGAFGIRDMQYDASRGVFLVVVGNSVSHAMTGFRVLAWDGNAEGTVTEISDLAFEPHFKVEGVCHGTIGGRGAIIFTDDGGGYQFVWDDDPRLGPIPPRSTASWSPADGLEVRR